MERPRCLPGDLSMHLPDDLSWKILRARQVSLGWLVTAYRCGKIADTFLPFRRSEESALQWRLKLENILEADSYEPMRSS